MRLFPFRLQFVLAIYFLVMFSSAALWAGDINPADVLLKHLDSIGSAAVRSQIKSRVVQGAATYRILVGGSGAIDGRFQFASEDQKSDYLFRVNAGRYLGEQFICDGHKTSVAGTYSDKTRSEFGNFILSQDTVLRENLLGGVWSTGWPLLDLEGRRAKLHADGTKKVDGKELIVLRYQPKKITDLNIFLYFDPETYRHVMTLYKMEPSTSVVGGETAQSGKQTRRYRIEERFSDFKTADGLTLPTHYDLRYTMEGESGFTKSIEWEIKSASIANNMSIDERSFEVQ
ncbi:MAG: hypothetical protein WAL71_04185 [Terriglobales bacterium]|jgi:outer membrane lipoprotein-sorting protein